MESVAYGVVLLLLFGSTFASGKDHDMTKNFDVHFRKLKNAPPDEHKSKYPNRRRTQLYSRNTGQFIQVTPKGKVVAQGADGDVYADLEILTVRFGKVHIRGKATSRYICFDKRGRLIAKKRDTARCIWREQHDKKAYTMYESEVLNGRFISFSRKGINRFRAVSRYGTKAVQFVERPRSKVIPNMRYYTSRGRKNPVSHWMIEQDKMNWLIKQKKLGLLRNENNPRLNRLLKENNKKKNRKNRNRYRKKADKRLAQKKANEMKSVEDYDADERFPPRRRFGAKKEKKSE
ncbi:uncharacterized protein LOC114538078 [Dendronephthya gigantea]|uniref:uncharacterized protein LOC114538078 n=1 Tax=Dendronephthya gigantea TaxID=151771 RepID=UPI001068E54D|nr:uncharacterized protein LOC114538078 [Dendronephthya gigantea]